MIHRVIVTCAKEVARFDGKSDFLIARIIFARASHGSFCVPLRRTHIMSSEAMKQMAPVIQGINSYRGTAIDNDKDYHKLVAKVRALAASAIHRAYIYVTCSV